MAASKRNRPDVGRPGRATNANRAGTDETAGKSIVSRTVVAAKRRRTWVQLPLPLVFFD